MLHVSPLLANLKTFPYVSVGVTCEEGEYGAGTQCIACGVDETSPAKSDDISDCVKGL